MILLRKTVSRLQTGIGLQLRDSLGAGVVW